jgi:phage-related protein
MSFIKFNWDAIPMTGNRCQLSGGGVREIRVRDGSGAYRVIYIATFADAIHVLHAFEKKSQKTARRDLDLAGARLRELKRGSI